MELSPTLKKISKSGKRFTYLFCVSCKDWVIAIHMNRHIAKCKVSQLLESH